MSASATNTSTQRVLGIGQLHHQSANALSCTTYTLDAVADRCHELCSHTQVAEWQTKWHNPPYWWVRLRHVWRYKIWNDNYSVRDLTLSIIMQLISDPLDLKLRYAKSDSFRSCNLDCCCSDAEFFVRYIMTHSTNCSFNALMDAISGFYAVWCAKVKKQQKLCLFMYMNKHNRI